MLIIYIVVTLAVIKVSRIVIIYNYMYSSGIICGILIVTFIIRYMSCYLISLSICAGCNIIIVLSI